MNLKKTNISIIGLGDSGYWSAKLASLLGANVFVSDSKENINEDYIQDLTDLNVKVELGNHSKEVLNSDLIIKSPGVPKDIEILQEAKKNNIQIIGEVEFAYEFSNLELIAITGTNGKTTTVSCLHKMLSKKFNVIKSGNIGIPFSKIVYEENKNIEKTIASSRPPIFWKDKDITKKQILSWNSKSLKKHLFGLHELEPVSYTHLTLPTTSRV